MSVRLTCALCGRELHRTGVTQQLRCPLHGSRWRGTATEEQRTPSAPSKPSLRDPDYDFGTSTDG